MKNFHKKDNQYRVKLVQVYIHITLKCVKAAHFFWNFALKLLAEIVSIGERAVEVFDTSNDRY